MSNAEAREGYNSKACLDGGVHIATQLVSHSQAGPVGAYGGLHVQQLLAGLHIAGQVSHLHLHTHTQVLWTCAEGHPRICAAADAVDVNSITCRARAPSFPPSLPDAGTGRACSCARSFRMVRLSLSILSAFLYDLIASS